MKILKYQYGGKGFPSSYDDFEDVPLDRSKLNPINNYYGPRNPVQTPSWLNKASSSEQYKKINDVFMVPAPSATAPVAQKP